MTAPVMVTRQGGDGEAGSVHDQRGAEGRRPNVFARILLHLFPLLLHPKTERPVIIRMESRRVSRKFKPAYSRSETARLKRCRTVIDRILREGAKA